MSIGREKRNVPIVSSQRLLGLCLSFISPKRSQNINIALAQAIVGKVNRSMQYRRNSTLRVVCVRSALPLD